MGSTTTGLAPEFSELVGLILDCARSCGLLPLVWGVPTSDGALLLLRGWILQALQTGAGRLCLGIACSMLQAPNAGERKPQNKNN
jgi:hypothetical protein